MVAFDDAGKYITEAFIVYKYQPYALERNVIGYVISKKGKPSQIFGTYVVELLEKQQELGFRIINRSGQCLSFLGENT
jgi:hypothetical protein